MECSHNGAGGCRDPSALTWPAQHEKQLPGISGKLSDLVDSRKAGVDCRKEISPVTAGKDI